MLESSPAFAIGCKGVQYSATDENPILFVDGMWAEFWNFGGPTNQLDPNKHVMRLPRNYIRCSIGNYGRTPVMMAKMIYHFEPRSEPLEVGFTIPAIIPNATFDIDIVDLGGIECIWPDSRLPAQIPIAPNVEADFTIARAGSSRIVMGMARGNGTKSVTVNFPPACDYSKPIPN